MGPRKFLSPAQNWKEMERDRFRPVSVNVFPFLSSFSFLVLKSTGMVCLPDSRHDLSSFPWRRAEFHRRWKRYSSRRSIKKNKSVCLSQFFLSSPPPFFKLWDNGTNLQVGGWTSAITVQLKAATSECNCRPRPLKEVRELLCCKHWIAVNGVPRVIKTRVEGCTRPNTPHH